MNTLIGCFARLTVYASKCGVDKRFFSLTSEMSRKWDSHAHPPYKRPSHKNQRWVPMKSMKELYDYTTDPIPIPRYGGRGPNGRIWNHRRGGGLKKVYYMIDHDRANPKLMKNDENTLKERIYEIIPDKNRSGLIAMVAGGEHKRWIVASETMKIGDVITSSNKVSESLIRPVLGNSYPIGVLPVGTVVSCIEKVPGKGALIAMAAGSFGTVTARKTLESGEEVSVVRMPSKREIIISSKCQATYGRVSNIDHHKKVWGKAGAKRQAGIRPRSGLWHRKTGRNGRKIRPIPPAVDMMNRKVCSRSSEFHIGHHVGIYRSRAF